MDSYGGGQARGCYNCEFTTNSRLHSKAQFLDPTLAQLLSATTLIPAQDPPPFISTLFQVTLLATSTPGQLAVSVINRGEALAE
jgi:hypothetical protein